MKIDALKNWRWFKRPTGNESIPYGIQINVGRGVCLPVADICENVPYSQQEKVAMIICAAPQLYDALRDLTNSTRDYFTTRNNFTAPDAITESYEKALQAIECAVNNTNNPNHLD